MPVEATFPKPLVVESLSGVHKHTIILLHGRGGSADTFGTALLNIVVPTTSAEIADLSRGGQTAGDGDTQTVTALDPGLAADNSSVELPNTPFAGTPSSPSRDTSHHDHAPHRQRGIPLTLAEALPHAKFVFPNAPKQRATVYKRSVMRQWFDDWHLRPELSGDFVSHRYDEGLQTSGLGDTVRYLHELIAKEADLVGGVGNIVIGGISQGCAASLVTALLWEGSARLGAVLGMCGWLPYLNQMKEAMQLQSDSAGETDGAGDNFELFERPTSPLPSTSVTGSVDAAVSWLRDELELPRIQSSGLFGAESRKAPVILCHGWDDNKVDRYQGQAAAEFLPCLGMEVRLWKMYDGVGHEYSEEMLVDILDCLESVLQGDSS